MKHILIFLLGISTASALECPLDRPIKKTVVDYTQPPKLICQEGYAICTLAPSNVIGPTHREMCFTKQEIENAK